MTLIIELPPAVEAWLSDEAKREGLSLEDYALKKLAEREPVASQGETGSGEYVLRLVQEFKESLPEEDWRGLPPDYATNYKEYVRARRAGPAK